MKQSLVLMCFRLLILLSGIFASIPHVLAQQDPLYGLYLNNPLVINPAYTGINNNLTAFASFRSQWAGFEGNPTTINAGGHVSLWRNKIGVGAMVVSDKIGENTNTQFTTSFAYKLPINEGTTLSFGMQAGFINYKSDPSQLALQDPTDPAFLPISQVKPTIGAGIILKGDRFMVGISVPRLVNSSFDMGGQKINIYDQHYYLMGAYLFHLSEKILFKPSVLLKDVSGAPLSADVNLNLVFSNISAGVYTRNLNSYGILAQINFLEKYRLSYALELPTNQSVGSRFVTNEIMISIRTALLSFHQRSLSNF